MQEVKTREQLEAMSKSELLRYADEQGIEVPPNYCENEIVNIIIASYIYDIVQKCTSDEPESEAEKPLHVIEHEKCTAELEKLVASAAVEHARRNAAAKAARKTFESLTDKLSEHLMSKPTPMLFDGEDDNDPKKENDEIEESNSQENLQVEKES